MQKVRCVELQKNSFVIILKYDYQKFKNHQICVIVLYASLLMHKITRFSGRSNNYLISISDACRQYIEMSTTTVTRYENIRDLYW